MLRLDAHRPATFCDGLTRRDFLHAGAGAARPDVARLPGAKAAGEVNDRDVNCIMLFLVGGPSHIDTWDPKPEAPAEVRGPFQADRHQRPRHADHRDLPAHGPARGQVLADPLGLPHRDGGPRHRPSDDADGPAVRGRHRASARRLRARLPQGPARRSAGPRAFAPAHRPHRRQPAAWPCRRLPRQAARSVHPQRRSGDAELPGARPVAARYISAVRAERRQRMRDAVDGAMAVLRGQRPGETARQQLSTWPIA